MQSRQAVFEEVITVTLVQISGPTFTADVVVGVEAAPIVRFMRLWTLEQIRAYCARKRWRVEVVEP